MLVCALSVHTAHETAGAARTRHSLRPLISKGEKTLQTSGATRRGNTNSCLSSLRGALAMKQSILSLPHDGLLRLLSRGLVLDDVPVLGEHAIVHAHDVGDDPRRRQAVTTEPAVENDEITRRRRKVVLIAQRRGQALDQAKQPVAAGRNMGAVLNVARRPEPLGGRVVALVEQGIERGENGLDMAVFVARSGWCGHGISPR